MDLFIYFLKKKRADQVNSICNGDKIKYDYSDYYLVSWNIKIKEWTSIFHMICQV